MATKRRTPLTDNPPNPDPDSSSSEGEGEGEEEEEEEDDDVEDESSSAEEQPQRPPPPPPQPQPKSIPKPQTSSPSSSSEDEDPDSDDDDDEQKEQQQTNNKKPPQPQSSSEPDSPKSPRSTDFTVKSNPQLAATPVSKATKRPAPAHIANSSIPKKPKPSSAINRLWSDEDEIAILEGLIEFKAKMGKDPSANQGAFHEFMKELLSVEVSKTQLMDKVRRLKRKFNNNVGKSSDGEDPVLSKPHEYKSFLLSKRIWGKLPEKNDDVKVNANVTNVKANAKVNDADDRQVNKGEKSSSRNAKKSKDSDKLFSDVVSVENDIAVKDFVKGKGEKVEPRDGKEDEFVKLYPFLMNAVLSDKLSNILPELNVVRRNLSYVGSSKLKELDDEWKNVNMAEAEVLLKKMDLMRTQTKMVLDAMKSP